MPCCPAGQLLAFQQHNIIPTDFGQVIGNGAADNAAANNDDPRLFGKFSHYIIPSSLRYRHHMRDALTPFQHAARPAT